MNNTTNLSHEDHPRYEPQKWNLNPYIRKSHNCYTYALNIRNKSITNLCKHHLFHHHHIHYHSKKNLKRCPRPLPIRKHITTPNKYFRCSDIIKYMTKKFNIIKPKKGICPYGYYKIALFLVYSEIDYKYLNDFHFYRQDNDGTWSHKDGWRKVTNKDSHGTIINNPELCAKRTSTNIFCGYYCVPNNISYNNKNLKTYYT